MFQILAALTSGTKHTGAFLRFEPQTINEIIVIGDRRINCTHILCGFFVARKTKKKKKSQNHNNALELGEFGRQTRTNTMRRVSA